MIRSLSNFPAQEHLGSFEASSFPEGSSDPSAQIAQAALVQQSRSHSLVAKAALGAALPPGPLGKSCLRRPAGLLLRGPARWLKAGPFS